MSRRVPTRVAAQPPIRSRRRSPARAHNFSQAEAVDALLASEQLYEAAALIPTGPGTGRRRDYPEITMFIWDALVHIYGTSYQVAASLEYRPSGLWKKIRAEVLAHTGIVLPTEPPKRHHYQYAKKAYLTDPRLLGGIVVALMESSLVAALSIGLLTPAKSGSLTRPSADNVVGGDVTVVKPANSPNAARRPGLDTEVYTTGTGEIVQGQAFVVLTTRGDDPDTRIVLAIVPVDRPGQEMAVVLATLRDLVATSEALRGVSIDAFVYDGAMRGTHIDQIQRDHGITVVSPIADANGGGDRHQPLGPIDEPTDGTHTHTEYQIRAVAGHAQLFVADEDGNLVLLEGAATRIQVKDRIAADSTHRRNVNYRFQLPCGCTQDRWYRTWNDPTDTFSRAENIRLIPRDDPHYDSIYGRRNDTESTHNSFKRAFPGRRARSNAINANWLSLITFTILSNAKTLWETHGLATGDPPTETIAA